MLRGRRFWIGLVVSLGFLGLFFYRTDTSRMQQAFLEANYAFALPAILVYFVGVVFRALRWRLLLLPIKAISARSLYPIVVIGYMANDIIPLRIGELVRAYILGEKEKVSKTAIIGTIAVERMFDGLALLFFMAVVSLFVPLPGFLGDFARPMAIIFIGALIALFVVASSETLADRVCALVPGKGGEKVRTLATSFLCGLRVMRSPKYLIGAFLFSCLSWLVEAATFWIVGFSFNLELPYHVMLLATAAANLAITLPSSPGGIGPFELLTRETIVLFGADTGVAGAYALVLHFAVLLIPVIILGFVFLWLENLTLAQVVQRREPASPVAAGVSTVKEEKR
ncbi:MAG: flippase-like domain-containing protein [Chloroflexi bacterium]|nr:flippase-like domain-containing protein [Chloroflexota bacterium]